MATAVDIIFPDRPLGVQNAIDTIAELRALDSTLVNINTEVLVAAQGFYKYDPSSLAADNGTTVIKPDDLTSLQAGRWELVLLFSASNVAASYDFVGAPVVSLLTIFRSGPCVLLHLCRLAAETDDNNALARAFTLGYPVYAQAGEGTGPQGQYLIQTPNGTTNVPSGAVLFGDGIGKTVFRKVNATTNEFEFFIDSGSDDPGNNLRNIYFHDFSIDGFSTFQPNQNTIWIGGVSDSIFERLGFNYFRSDAFYIGSGNNVGETTERHNINITIQNCIFDGVTNENRNGISVIDGDGIRIIDNEFRNVSKLDGSMPGPIDLEPEASTFHVVRNIIVTGNRFYNCGGACFAILLRANSFPIKPYQQFIFADNYIENCYSAFTVFGYATTGALTGVQPYDVTIENNCAKGLTERICLIEGALGVSVLNNQFEDSDDVVLGNVAANKLLTFAGNRYIRCGLGGFVYRQVTSLENVTISDYFLNCGKADGTQGWIYYLVGAAADAVELHLDNNVVEIIGATKTTAFAVLVGGHGGSVNANCTKIGNVLPTLGTPDNLILSGIGPQYLTGSQVSDVGSIANGARGTVSITVTGAKVGDQVVGISGSTALEAGLFWAGGECTAANTAVIGIGNLSGGGIDPASRTYYATVLPRVH